jgi:hypothetical protein
MGRAGFLPAPSHRRRGAIGREIARYGLAPYRKTAIINDAPRLPAILSFRRHFGSTPWQTPVASMTEEAAPTSLPPGWRVHAVADDVTVVQTETSRPLSAALAGEIETHWLAAQATCGGALFNGAVFSVDDITPTHLRGHMTEYRRILAQFRDPALFATLRLRPLAVCGVLLSPDGIVFGRRQGNAVYQSGLWQTPPAGNVDGRATRARGRVDLHHQIFAELHEELGLAPDAVRLSRPLALVEHGGSHVLDLGFLLTTDLPFTAIAATHARAGNDEYETLRCIPPAALAAWLARMGPDVVPSVPILLHAAGLIGAETCQP